MVSEPESVPRKMCLCTVKERAKYANALAKCHELVAQLREIQSVLRGLIDGYGIKRGGRRSKTLRRLLEPPRLQPPEEWARRN